MPFDNPRPERRESSTLINLRAARALIAAPGGYISGVRKAARRDGSFSYCALGALDEACRRLHYSDGCPEVYALAAVLPADFMPGINEYPASRVAHFNNEKGRDAIVAVFDAAIARLEAMPEEDDAETEETPRVSYPDYLASIPSPFVMLTGGRLVMVAPTGAELVTS